MFSAFNPSKWSSGQPTFRRPGSSWGFGALLKGLTSVLDTSCRSRDSNPQPRVSKSQFSANLWPDDPQGNMNEALFSLKNPEVLSSRVYL